ncbi:MAG: class I SAM-dependent methyltransferase [Patescibacteria group bacterium]
MQSSTKKQHWEKIYKEKDTTTDVSWYQNNPKTSIELILSTGAGKGASIIDIGGGDSRLVDRLLELKYKKIFVLDISGEALMKIKKRLGEKASSVTWIESDILKFNTKARFDVWHDRATFHFLTKGQDIFRYVKITDRFLKPGGFLIISTFSLSGPKKCSGLDTSRYSDSSMQKAFGEKFNYIKSFERIHETPFNTKQSFLWSVFKKPIN